MFAVQSPKLVLPITLRHKYIDLQNMRSTSRLRILLILCIVGSVIGAIGAAFISSGSNEMENLGMPIHQVGLLVMLIGFGGLLLRGRVRESEEKYLFRWKQVDNQILVYPKKASEVLLVSLGSLSGSGDIAPRYHYSKTVCEQVMCVVWPEDALSFDQAAKLLMLKNLRVLDLSRCSEMSDEAAAELEGLEQAECLILPRSTSVKAFKRLRIALPEALLDESRQGVIVKAHLSIRSRESIEKVKL